jgi:tetratricopeptide (TPR) repeat protein
VARFRLLAWSLVGAFLGLLLGTFVSANGQGGPGVIAACIAGGWAATYFGPLWIMSLAGRAGSGLYAPSGSTTPRKREYSLAESYAARGDYERAVTAFEEAIAEDPTDPQPYVRVARLQRDRMNEPEAAASWFRRALRDAALSPSLHLLTLRELVELYDGRLGQPERAAPLLARLADEQAGTPDGAWAVEELARIKRRMAEGEGRG